VKQIHYLAGLPRSGNTVLSTILNQHPDIYSSPLSPMPDLTLAVHTSYYQTEGSVTNPQPQRLKSLISSMQESFYSDVKEPIVFDRDKCWTTPTNFSLVKNYMSDSPKVVLTVRPVLEILASYVTQAKSHDFLKYHMEREGFLPRLYLPLEDAYCDYLMSPTGLIVKCLLGLSNALLPENTEFVHLVDYGSLVDNPKEVMEGIYDFIGVEQFDHNFSNLQKIEVDNDTAISLPPDFHLVRKQLQKTSPKVEDVLSDYVLNKYSSVNFWI
jgi:sulfotransferase